MFSLFCGTQILEYVSVVVSQGCEIRNDIRKREEEISKESKKWEMEQM